MKLEPIEEPQYFTCDCYSDQHTLKFSYDSDEDFPSVYTSVFLGHVEGFFGRCWYALKYIFGYKCRYGHFDCFLLAEKDLDRLILLLQTYKDDINKRRAKKEKKDDIQGGVQKVSNQPVP